MSAKAKKKTLKQKLMALVMLLTGGAGIGGWQLKDYPLVKGLISRVTGEEVSGDTTLKDVARTGVSRLVETKLDSKRPGVFEVSIDELSLDPAAFKPGQKIDIQARVRSTNSEGIERIVWDSADLGSQRAVVGRDELTASWANRPFQLDWAPGESVVVEVYGKQLLSDRVLFQTSVEDSSSFPLRSGKRSLISMTGGRKSAGGEPESESRIVLSSKRVASQPGATGQVAGDGRNPVR